MSASPAARQPSHSFPTPLLPREERSLHYNWKYAFVRPTMDEIIERYNAKFNDKSKPDAADVDVVASAIVAGHNAS